MAGMSYDIWTNFKAKNGTRAVFSAVKAGLNGLHGASTKVQRGLRRIAAVTGGIKLAGLASATAATALFAKSVFEAGVKIDRLRNSLSVATGSIASANGGIKEMMTLSNKLGVNFDAVSQSFGRFMMASKEVGFATGEARDIFESVTIASGAMGLSADSTRLTLKALEQMISKGTVQAEELRGQLGEHLPGAFGLAAASMKVTTGELIKMMENGELMAKDLLPRLSAVLRDKFAPIAERAAKQPLAALNRMRNAWFELLVAVNKSGLGKLIASMMDWIAAKLRWATQNSADFAKWVVHHSIRIAKGFMRLKTDAQIAFIMIKNEFDSVVTKFREFNLADEIRTALNEMLPSWLKIKDEAEDTTNTMTQGFYKAGQGIANLKGGLKEVGALSEQDKRNLYIQSLREDLEASNRELDKLATNLMNVVGAPEDVSPFKFEGESDDAHVVAWMDNLKAVEEAERESWERRITTQGKYGNQFMEYYNGMIDEQKRKAKEQKEFAISMGNSAFQSITSGQRKLNQVLKNMAVDYIKQTVLPKAMAQAYEWGVGTGGGPLAGAAAAAVTGAAIGGFINMMGGGGSSGGSTSSPVSEAVSTSEPQQQRGQATINIYGNILGEEDYVRDNLIPMIRNEIDENDVVIFGNGSRQAQEIASA